jgi:hypothetical protein
MLLTFEAPNKHKQSSSNAARLPPTVVVVRNQGERMDFDREREKEKREELLDQIVAALESAGVSKPDAATLGTNIFDNYISTSPPEEKPLLVEFVVINRMGEGGGKSTKPGNIRLNIGQFMEAVASGVLTGLGVAQMPLTAPLAALVIWCSLWRSSQVSISEMDAAVLYTMWAHKDERRDIANDGLLEKCNFLLTKYDKPEISQQTLNRSLKALEEIETIEKSPRNSDSWWLREWVRVSYR